VALPVLVKVKLCTALVWPTVVGGNVRVVLGVIVSTGAVLLPPVPVPSRISETLVTAALSVADSTSASDPAVCGLKVKTNVQLALMARVVVGMLQVLAEVSVKDVVFPTDP